MGSSEAATCGSLNLAARCVSDPGYGPAEGVPSEESVDSAVRAALAAAAELGYAPHDVIIMGRSIGSGPATRAAAALCDAGTPPAALVLQSAYTAIRDLARGLVGPVAAACLLDRWPSVRAMPRISCPLFLVHGADDPLIPPAHATALRDAARRSPAVQLQ